MGVRGESEEKRGRHDSSSDEDRDPVNGLDWISWIEFDKIG